MAVIKVAQIKQAEITKEVTLVQALQQKEAAKSSLIQEIQFPMSALSWIFLVPKEALN